MRLCAGDVSWLLQNGGNRGCGNSGADVYRQMIGCNSLLMPVCGSVGSGFTGKRESNVWVVRAGT